MCVEGEGGLEKPILYNNYFTFSLLFFFLTVYDKVFLWLLMRLFLWVGGKVRGGGRKLTCLYNNERILFLLKENVVDENDGHFLLTFSLPPTFSTTPSSTYQYLFSQRYHLHRLLLFFQFRKRKTSFGRKGGIFLRKTVRKNLWTLHGKNSNNITQ